MPLATLGATTWELPPLILHPFNERVAADSLLENSRAALMLSGLIPGDGSSREDLQRRILAGRLGEIRMLFFLGKDVMRWMEQCQDAAARFAGLDAEGITARSFAGLLTAYTPDNVKEKLQAWGVAAHQSIFRRAIGLNALFATAPQAANLGQDFLRSYHRYADNAYTCYMEGETHREIGPAAFRFELYASGEYSKMLEVQWAAD